MSGLKIMKEHIYYNQRPFTSAQIVDATGICYETVKKHLQILIAEAYVKKIGTDKGKNVYIYNKNKDAPKQYRVAQKHYTIESVQEAYRRQIKKRREWFDDLL